MDSLKVLDQSVDRINFYINLENVFKVIMNPRVDSFMKASCQDRNESKLNLVSNIINLGQHYRLYAAKYGKESRIILFWNYPKSEYKNEKYIDGYRSYYNHKMFQNMSSCDFLSRLLEESYSFLTIVMKYINQVYLISGGSIESSVIPLLVHENVYAEDGISTQNIIITNEKYDYQYHLKGFTILEPNKENPILVKPEDDVIELLKKQAGIKNKKSIPTNLIPFTICLLGNKYRNIPKLAGVGLGTIINMINVAIDRIIITENSTDVNLLKEIITINHREQFVKNYLCTNLDYQMKEITPLEINLITRQLEDKFDDNTVKQMNERYFKKFPLMIIKSRSEQVYNDNYPRKSIFDK